MPDNKFRITKQEYANRTLRFPVDLLNELTAISSRNNISLNALVVDCCRYALENIEED